MVSLNKFLLTNLLAFLCICLNAQGLSKGDIEIKYNDSPHQGRIVVSYIKNNYSEGIIVRLTNEYGTGGPVTFNIRAGEPREIDITCNIVEAKPQSGGTFIDIIRKPKPKESKKQEEETQPSPPVINKPEPKKKYVSEVKPIQQTTKGPLTIEDVVPDFVNYLETILFLSSTAIEEETSNIEEHLNSLRNWKDKDAYIREHHLKSYINSIRDSLAKYDKYSTKDSLITSYTEKFGKRTIENKNYNKSGKMANPLFYGFVNVKESLSPPLPTDTK